MIDDRVEPEREIVATGKGALLSYLLMVRGRLHVSYIARRLECTERHVYRIVDNASAAGVPLTIEGGWVEMWLNGRDI